MTHSYVSVRDKQETEEDTGSGTAQTLALADAVLA